jgi:hypothetical protein
VSAGDARHGRRDNGLVAAEYAAAGDVDPRVGEHLLDVLALDGIAAYLRPSTDLHPVTRSTMLPSRPTDRLYVDRAHVATAREYLNRLAAEAEPPAEPMRPTEPSTASATEPKEPTAREVDEAWERIVAGYDATAEPPQRPSALADPLSDVRPGRSYDDWTPQRRDSDWDDDLTVDPSPPPRSTPLLRAEQSSLLDGLDTFGAELPDDDDEEGFVPPVPPPVPRPSLPTALAVIGIVGGLAVFLKPDLLGFISESVAMFLGFTAVVTGFGTLVWRLRPGDDDDDIDPYDDGAKV